MFKWRKVIEDLNLGHVGSTAINVIECLAQEDKTLYDDLKGLASGKRSTGTLHCEACLASFRISVSCEFVSTDD